MTRLKIAGIYVCVPHIINEPNIVNFSVHYKIFVGLAIFVLCLCSLDIWLEPLNSTHCKEDSCSVY
jgi:hypothetical protein